MGHKYSSGGSGGEAGPAAGGGAHAAEQPLAVGATHSPPPSLQVPLLPLQAVDAPQARAPPEAARLGETRSPAPAAELLLEASASCGARADAVLHEQEADESGRVRAYEAVTRAPQLQLLHQLVSQRSHVVPADVSRKVQQTLSHNH